ncbi:MAG TPA: hypothetical protein VKY74_20905 [Chloroflexia bacterium]|nr:hypothetical protein [Chloroflexia bacterium]
MKQLIIVLLVALVALAFGPAAQVRAAGKVVRITLIDENGSGEDGSAQLTDQGDGTTKVELLMMNAPDGAVQPAHIHKGTCTTLDPTPAYPLNDVTGGKSTTIVKVALATLLAEHYAINVHKSATEIASYISCGTLPLASATSGALTADQALAQLLDLAGQMDAQIQKQEVDASHNALVQYQAAFTGAAGTIGAKSADLRTQLDDQQTAVDSALTAGDFTKAHTAAATLVSTLQAATSSGASSQPAAAMTTVMATLQTGAADLVRETGNKDPQGAQAAYDAFHTAFAAHETDLTAKAPNETAELTAAQTEVHDALQAGDWTKANNSAKEIQKSVSDAMGTMGITASTLPTTGTGTLPLLLLVLAATAGAAILVGGTLRLRPGR